MLIHLYQPAGRAGWHGASQSRAAVGEQSYEMGSYSAKLLLLSKTNYCDITGLVEIQAGGGEALSDGCC